MDKLNQELRDKKTQRLHGEENFEEITAVWCLEDIAQPTELSNVGQAVIITGYDETTKVATVNREWTVTKKTNKTEKE